MAEWFNFALYSLKELVTMFFSWDLGLGFTFGDFQVALMIIVIVASALIVRSSSLSFRHDDDISVSGKAPKDYHKPDSNEKWVI